MLAAAGGSFGVDGDEEIGEDEEADGESGEERLLLWCSLEAGVELLLLWCSLEAGVDGERAGSVGCGQNLPLLEVGCRAICEGGAGEGRLCWVLPAAEGKKMREKKQGEGAGCLGFRRRRLGEKNSNPARGGGGRLPRDRVRFRVCFFFCIFLMFQNYPPSPLFELWTSIYR